MSISAIPAATACRITRCSRFPLRLWTRQTDPSLTAKSLPFILRHHQSSAAAPFLRTSLSPSQSSTRNSPPSSFQPSTPIKLPFTTSTPFSENPNHAYTSPYKAKRLWPPDMAKLSPKQQFRLERKYRRRAKLKWARPTWKKWTKLIQWSVIGAVLVYSLFFMELKNGGPNPFHTLREYVRNFFNDSVWSSPRGVLRTDSNVDMRGQSNEGKQS